MSAAPRDREARAIALLVDAHLNPPDEWGDEHHAVAEEAARVAAEWVRRDGRNVTGDTPETPAKTRRPGQRPSQVKRQRRATPPGHWTLTDAREFVRNRSRGLCEAETPVCAGTAVHVHHKRGRGGPDPHNPELLLNVCEPCHLYAHRYPAESYKHGWMVKRLGASS